MKKTLLIARGIPSSGKSTKIKTLVPENYIFSADKFFEKDGYYRFDRTLLGRAHSDCKNGVERAMQAGVDLISVDNTMTTYKETQPYLELAKKYGYSVEIMESDRPEWKKMSKLLDDKKRNWQEIEKLSNFFYEDNKKTHNVPKEAILAMLKRWIPTKNIQI